MTKTFDTGKMAAFYGALVFIEWKILCNFLAIEKTKCVKVGGENAF